MNDLPFVLSLLVSSHSTLVEDEAAKRRTGLGGKPSIPPRSPREVIYGSEKSFILACIHDMSDPPKR